MTAAVKEGDFWLVVSRCQFCGVEIRLKSEEEPNPLSIRLAAVAFRVCESCAVKIEEAEEHAEGQQAFTRRVEAARLPPSLQELSWEDMVASGDRAAAIGYAKEWSRAERSRGLYLWGPAGVGKTRLAATATWSRLDRWPIRWISVAVLVAQLDAAWADTDRREALKVLTGAGALVLDDFDKVVPSERGRNHLFTAIDTRIEAGTPMIVTANLPVSKIGEKFGMPIASRIAGYFEQFELPGPDRRLELDAG